MFVRPVDGQRGRAHHHWVGGGGQSDAPVLRERGYEVVELPGVRSRRGLESLWRFLRAARPEIVHVHAESCHDAVALVSKASRVNGIVRTVHNSFPFAGNLRLRRKTRAALSRRLGVTWVACAESVAENEQSRFGNTTVVVENWVGVDALISGATAEAGQALRAALGVGSVDTVLGVIGNCGEAKNHELVPQALIRVSKPAHVLHVGELSRMPSSELAMWLQLPDRHAAHHLGPRDDIPALLAACDLFLLPSRYEGLPLVAIEALCAGVPILAADVAPLQWLLEYLPRRLPQSKPRVGRPRSRRLWAALGQTKWSCPWNARGYGSALRVAFASTSRFTNGCSARPRLGVVNPSPIGQGPRLSDSGARPSVTGPGIEAEPPEVGDSLARSALTGVAWNYSGAMVLIVTQIISTAVTARLIAPSQFGAYAVAQAAAGVFGYFTLGALGAGLLRRQVLGPTTVGTAGCCRLSVAAWLPSRCAL